MRPEERKEITDSLAKGGRRRKPPDAPKAEMRGIGFEDDRWNYVGIVTYAALCASLVAIAIALVA